MNAILLVSVLLTSAHIGDSTQPVERIYFEPVVINNVKSEGVMYAIDETSLRAKLARQFADWMVRSVPGNRLAKSAEVFANQKPLTGDCMLKTVMNIPLTHRADFSHFSNAFRRGKFMDFTMTLTNSSGQVVATAASTLVWGDGHWYQGAGRSRKSVDHDQVMAGYVRKAVDRGIGMLTRQMKP